MGANEPHSDFKMYELFLRLYMLNKKGGVDLKHDRFDCSQLAQMAGTLDLNASVLESTVSRATVRQMIQQVRLSKTDLTTEQLDQMVGILMGEESANE